MRGAPQPLPPGPAAANCRKRQALGAAPGKAPLCLSERRRWRFAALFSTLSAPRGSPCHILSRFWLFQNAHLPDVHIIPCVGQLGV
jgi:hypothetical protein